MKLLIPFLFVSVLLTAQEKTNYPGTYTDQVVRLTLNSDNTFSLKQPDPVFSYTHQNFESSGTWIAQGKEVVLNPHLKKRTPIVTFSEKYIPGTDSVAVKINYILETYQNEKLVSREPSRFEMFTVYVNKKRNYHHLVRQMPGTPSCLFGTRIKKPYIIDSLSIVKFKSVKVEKIGIKSYGFDDFVELNPKDLKSNYFEVTVIQPIDTDRLPRSKKVRINTMHAYYYEHNGKYYKLAPLYRKEEAIVTE